MTKKNKVMTILGTRPQIIKAAVVSPELANFTDEIIVHTGQHFDKNMSDIFFEELDLPKPHHFLDVHGGDHGSMTGRMMIELEKVLLSEKPSLVLLYGDTNSTLAGALVASKLHIPIAHVEAGVRSFNKKMPEEINRIITDQLSCLHFIPSSGAKTNLLREGIPSSHIYEVGDVMYDLAMRISAKIKNRVIVGKNDNWVNINYDNFVLVTIHRAENTNDIEILTNIFNFLFEIQLNVPVVLILHPRTKIALQQTQLFDKVLSRLTVISPVSYENIASLLNKASLVITDSGGLQKEAYYHRVKCLTLRNETEWVELCNTGWNKVASPQNSGCILEKFNDMMNTNTNHLDYPLLYGDGNAGKKISQLLNNFFM